jgi:hypothetical protein
MANFACQLLRRVYIANSGSNIVILVLVRKRNLFAKMRVELYRVPRIFKILSASSEPSLYDSLTLSKVETADQIVTLLKEGMFGS